MRVLVVEDEMRMAALLKRGLEEEGYAVDVAGDGQDALFRGTQVDYDAIVLDAMLPLLDGFEVCRELRSRQRWSPVLMLTARDGVGDRVRGLDAGADDYLSSPSPSPSSRPGCGRCCAEAPGERPTVLEVGDLKLDPAMHTVTRAGVEIELTAKEFALLELLMRHPGQVLTRTRILEHVWDFAFDPVSNVVDQYVAYLRRKIDRPFGREDLETVRGTGYRLRASAAAMS